MNWTLFSEQKPELNSAIFLMRKDECYTEIYNGYYICPHNYESKYNMNWNILMLTTASRKQELKNEENYLNVEENDMWMYLKDFCQNEQTKYIIIVCSQDRIHKYSDSYQRVRFKIGIEKQESLLSAC